MSITHHDGPGAAEPQPKLTLTESTENKIIKVFGNLSAIVLTTEEEFEKEPLFKKVCLNLSECEDK